MTFDRRWKDIGRCLGTPEDELTASTTSFFKQVYGRYIAPYVDQTLRAPLPDDAEEAKLHRRGRMQSRKRQGIDDEDAIDEATQWAPSLAKSNGGSNQPSDKAERLGNGRSTGAKQGRRRARFSSKPSDEDDEDDNDCDFVYMQGNRSQRVRATPSNVSRNQTRSKDSGGARPVDSEAKVPHDVQEAVLFEPTPRAQSQSEDAQTVSRPSLGSDRYLCTRDDHASQAGKLQLPADHEGAISVDHSGAQYALDMCDLAKAASRLFQAENSDVSASSHGATIERADDMHHMEAAPGNTDDVENNEEQDDEERESAFQHSGEIALQRGEDETAVSGARGLAKAARDLSVGHSDHLCEVCGGGGAGDKMVLCDRCDRGFHAFCLVPELEQLSEGSWYCSDCTQVIYCLHEIGTEPRGTITLDFLSKYGNAIKKRFSKSLKVEEPSIEELLELYWSIVDTEYDGAPVEVLCAEDKGESTFFDEASNTSNVADGSHSSSPDLTGFGLSSAARSEGNLLRHIPSEIANEAERSIRFGSLFSTIGWGFEVMDLPSVSFLHWGDSKVWYSVGQQCSSDAESAVQSVLKRSLQAYPRLLHSREAMTNIRSVESSSSYVQVHSIVQEQGTIVVTIPRAFTACVDMGANVCEKVNIAPASSWLPYSSAGLSRLHVLHVSPPFSLSQVLLRSAKCLLPREIEGAAGYWLCSELTRLLHNEAKGRNRALKRGVVRSRRVSNDWDENQEWCCVCGSDLWGSRVSCMRCDPGRKVCLKHIEALCDCQPDPNHLLVYRCTIASLQDAIEKLLAERQRRRLHLDNDRTKGNSHHVLEGVVAQSSPDAELDLSFPHYPEGPPYEAKKWMTRVERNLALPDVKSLDSFERLAEEGEQYVWAGKEMDEVRRLHDNLTRAIAWAKRLPWPERGCSDSASLDEARDALKSIDNGCMPISLAGVDIVRERIYAAAYAEERARTALEAWPRRENQLIDAAKEGEACEFVQTPLCTECRRLLDMTKRWRNEAAEVLGDNGDGDPDSRLRVERVKELLNQEQSEGLPLQSWEVEAARASMKEALSFSQQVDSMISQRHPELNQLESMVSEAKKMKVRPPSWYKLAAVIDECTEWRKRTEMYLNYTAITAHSLDMLFREGLCMPAWDSETLRRLSYAKKAMDWSERHKHLFGSPKTKKSASVVEIIDLEEARAAVDEAEMVEHEANAPMHQLSSSPLPRQRLDTLREFLRHREEWAHEVQNALREAKRSDTDCRIPEEQIEELLQRSRSLMTSSSFLIQELERLLKAARDWNVRASPLLKPKPPAKKTPPYLAHVSSAESLLDEAQAKMLVKPRSEAKLDERTEITRQFTREAKQVLDADSTYDLHELERRLEILDSLRKRAGDLYFDVGVMVSVNRAVPALRAETRARRLIVDGGSHDEGEKLLNQNILREELKQQLEEHVHEARDWARRTRMLMRPDRASPSSGVEAAQELLDEGSNLKITPQGELQGLARAIEAHREWCNRWESTFNQDDSHRLCMKDLDAALKDKAIRSKSISSPLYDKAYSVAREVEQWRVEAREVMLRKKHRAGGRIYDSVQLLQRAFEYMHRCTSDALEALTTTADKYIDERDDDDEESAQQLELQAESELTTLPKLRDKAKPQHFQDYAVELDDDETLAKEASTEDTDWTAVAEAEELPSPERSLQASQSRKRKLEEIHIEGKGPSSKKVANEGRQRRGTNFDEVLMQLETDKRGRYCLCRRPDFGTPMVSCSSCGKWFHGSCVGLRVGEMNEGWWCPICNAWIEGNLAPLEYRQSISAQRALTRMPSRDVLGDLLDKAKKLRAHTYEENLLTEILDEDMKYRKAVTALWQSDGPVLETQDRAERGRSAFLTAFATEIPPFDEVSYLAWLAFGNSWRIHQAQAAFAIRRPTFAELGQVSQASGIGRPGMMLDHIGQELESLLHAAHNWLKRANLCLQNDQLNGADEARELAIEACTNNKLQRVDLGTELLGELQRRGERHCVCNEPQCEMEMVGCDLCDRWFHMSCVGFEQYMLDFITRNDLPYFCPECCKAQERPYTIRNQVIPIPEPGTAGPSSRFHCAKTGKVRATQSQKMLEQSAPVEENELSRPGSGPVSIRPEPAHGQGSERAEESVANEETVGGPESREQKRVDQALDNSTSRSQDQHHQPWPTLSQQEKVQTQSLPLSKVHRLEYGHEQPQEEHRLLSQQQQPSDQAHQVQHLSQAQQLEQQQIQEQQQAQNQRKKKSDVQLEHSAASERRRRATRAPNFKELIGGADYVDVMDVS